MSAPKTGIPKGLLIGPESAYGTLPSLVVGTHGVEVADKFDPNPQAGFDGTRPDPPGTAGTQIRVAPQGITLEPTFKVEAKGSGAAYSSTVFARNFHTLLQAAGFVATGSFGGGTEKYTYVYGAPTAAPTSFGAELYLNGTTAGTWERWRLNGGYADFLYEVENGQQSFFTFNTKGRLNEDPVEQAVGTAITYAPSVLTPVAAPLVLSVNGVSSHAISSIKVQGNRAIDARYPDQNQSGAHAGFHPGRRAPTFTFILEDPLWATANYWTLWKAGTVFASSSFQVGSAQYNRLKWAFAQMQVMKQPTKSYKGEAAQLEVTCSLHNSTPTANDDVQLVTD